MAPELLCISCHLGQGSSASIAIPCRDGPPVVSTCPAVFQWLPWPCAPFKKAQTPCHPSAALHVLYKVHNLVSGMVSSSSMLYTDTRVARQEAARIIHHGMGRSTVCRFFAKQTWHARRGSGLLASVRSRAPTHSTMADSKGSSRDVSSDLRKRLQRPSEGKRGESVEAKDQDKEGRRE